MLYIQFMAELSEISIDVVQWRVEDVHIPPSVNTLADLVASKSPSSPYISPSDLTCFAVRLLLLTQPIISYEHAGKCYCICGIRTLQAAKTCLKPDDLVPVHMIEKSSISDEQLIQLAQSDLYLKSFFSMFARDPDVLAQMYNIIGKGILKHIAPGHHTKSKFAQDADYSRQRVFYERIKNDGSDSSTQPA